MSSSDADSQIPMTLPSEESPNGVISEKLPTDPSEIPSGDLPEEHTTNPSKPSLQAENTDTTDDVKKCWICFADETEDTPDSSRWVTPCPCALTAHEACLLDWIADIKKTNRTADHRQKIQCPQCKYDLVLAENKDTVVSLVEELDGLISESLYVGLGLTLAGTLYSACTLYGLAAIQVVFGTHDAKQILQVDEHEGLPAFAFLRGLTADTGNLWKKAELLIGLPTIPLALVLNRTAWAHYRTPVLPLFLLISQFRQLDRTEFGRIRWQWPPEPEGVFALLPYVAEAYDKLYEIYVGGLEKQWDKELANRIGADAEEERLERENAQHQHQHHRGGNGDIEVLIEIDVDDPTTFGVNRQEPTEEDEAQEEAVTAEAETDAQDRANTDPAAYAEFVAEEGGDPEEGEWEDMPNENEGAPGRRQNSQTRAELPPRLGNIQRDGQQGLPPEIQARVDEIVRQAVERQQQGMHPAEDDDWLMSRILRNASETVLGALLFPGISAIAGWGLRQVLPSQWTEAPIKSWFFTQGSRPGLLATRWGRTVIGGCLFVVLKDSFYLYAKWRAVQQIRSRHVVDFMGQKYYHTDKEKSKDSSAGQVQQLITEV